VHKRGKINNREQKCVNIVFFIPLKYKKGGGAGSGIRCADSDDLSEAKGSLLGPPIHFRRMLLFRA